MGLRRVLFVLFDVFDRYNIFNDTDLKEAAQGQEAYLKAQMPTKALTVSGFDTKKGLAKNAQTLNGIGAGGRNRTDTDTRPGGF